MKTKRHHVSALAALLLLCAAYVPAAQALQPFQQKALEKLLANVEPESRELARPQLEQMVAMMNEAQINIMLSGLAAQERQQQQQQQAPEPEPEQPAREATPEDLAYNRAQYEPVIRARWQAQKNFDDFITAKLAQFCAPQGTYAVFGSAWRYEVYPPNPSWPTASNNADIDVEVLGSSYAPQDGRYKFDFSGVRTDFNRARVEQAVQSACGEYTRVGKQFMADARPLAEKEDLPPIGRLESRANGQLSKSNEALAEIITAESPSGSYDLFTALRNPARIK